MIVINDPNLRPDRANKKLVGLTVAITTINGIYLNFIKKTVTIPYYRKIVGNASREDLLRDTWLKPGDMECAVLPANPNSFGVWEKLSDPQDGTGFWNYALPYLEIMFALVFLLWNFFHFFLKRLGVNRFASHMLAGILLSKTVIPEGTAARSFFFRQDYKEIVMGLSGAFAYTMFWFLMGVKMDMTLIANSGKKAITIGLCTVIMPILICSGIFLGNLRHIGGKTGEPEQRVIEVVVLYAVQCVSTYPVIGGLLFDLKIQNSELGRIAMSASVTSDFFTSGLSFVLIFLKELKELRPSPGAPGTQELAIFRAGSVIVFVLFAIYVFKPAMIWVVKSTPEGRPVKQSYIYNIVTLVFGSCVYAMKAKHFLPMGAFILGLAIPNGPPLGSAIVEKFEPAIFGTLLPFFVASCAAEMDVWKLLASKDRDRDYFVIAIILLTFVIKFVMTACPAMLFHVPVKDGLALALILSYKGIFELGSYALAFHRRTIRPETFTLTIFWITINAIIIPIILKLVYDPARIYAGYRKRNMMHMKPNSELRILTCIHRPSDISPMINLLDASCATKESPVVAFVLHLIELVGKAQHVFISHQMQTRKPGRVSYSENVIISFGQFQREYWGLVSANTFTAISTPKTMHNDICMLALNNTTSLIVLPFHQTWSVDSSTIISKSAMIRDLNKSVLELTPCSVAILVSRGRLGRKTLREVALAKTSYQVCMIFLGGKDDREALTLAKRMTRHSQLSLTVVRLVAASDNDQVGGATTDWDSVLDSTGLRDVMQNAVEEENVAYVEEVVIDVSELPVVLKSMADEYDMFVVGRGGGRTSPLTKGLEDWCEFKELGVIGDLLTSPDLNSKASVLVIQQQQQMI